ncbi:HD domain-containing protein [Patescibacteria group bacterium]|nr:HD domain-containing protein [Patescibacteria group bacterium]
MDILNTSNGQILRALTIASQYHNGLMRKSEPIPAIIHPITVALIVAMHKRDPDVISAALLHDILEDTAYTSNQLKTDFGPKVAWLVNGVSVLEADCDNQASWRQRKKAYIDKIAVNEFDHMLICTADKIHNLSSLIMSHKTQGDKLWDAFNASSQEYAWYYTTLLQTLRKQFRHPLVDQLGQLIELAEPIMNQSLATIE